MSILESIVKAIANALGGRPLSRAELEAKLDDLAIKHPERLEWRTSIVDLMKLVNMDSSLNARERLAAELKYEGHYNGDPAMNNFLHAQVMQKLASTLKP